MAPKKQQTQTKPKDKPEMAQPAPAAQLPATVDEPVNWQAFENELKARQSDYASMLGQSMPVEKFMSYAMAAIKQNPDLLNCTKRSLFNAIMRSAQDGIMPDGKEGVITSYNTKVSKTGQPDRWVALAQWNPMAHGLRKRAKALDGILIDAQLIYSGDKFLWEQGDAPFIKHVPAQLGTLRGDMIGAYAIFKREDGTILHREVMAAGDIDRIREQSKAPDGLMWKKFTGEAWRKTVLRRGIKTVPVSQEMGAILERDDKENFSFENAGGASQHLLVDGEVRPPVPKTSEFSRQAEPAQEQRSQPVKEDPKAQAREEPRPDPKVGAHVTDVEDEDEAEPGEGPSEQAAADARAALDESVKRAKDAMNQAETVGRLAMVFGELVGNFPPEGPHAKELTVFYEARQQEIKNRVKK